MTDIVKHEPSNELAQQMEYARVVSTGDLLPQQYRGKPANVLIAVGLGQSMGLSPTESLYRIDVIQGKPTASAELIASNVRRAGHKLRLRVDDQAVSATCTIVRTDDPDFEHTVTRDKAWAQQMGLLTKDNYKKQPATMLGWRAITACARQACPEALYGVAYTPDELDDIPRGRSDQQQPAMTTATFTQQSEPTDVSYAEVVEDEPEPGITPQQSKALHAAFTAAGITEREQRLAYCRNLTGADIDSSNDLTKAQASDVLDALHADAEATPDDDAEPDDGFMVQQEAGQ